MKTKKQIRKRIKELEKELKQIRPYDTYYRYLEGQINALRWVLSKEE